MTQLAVTGDVGVLAEENAQRLVSIFAEAATSCLGSLHEVAEARSKPGAVRLQAYARGLASVRNWSLDMLNAEIARLEAQYPETATLHRFVVISMLSEAAYAHAIASLHVPPLAETYHAFLKRVFACSDTQDVARFLDAPLAQRRVVFIDAFRNAYHDVARRSAAGKSIVLPSQGSLPAISRAGTACGSERNGSVCGSDRNGSVCGSVAQQQQQSRLREAVDLMQPADPLRKPTPTPPTSPAGKAGAGDGTAAVAGKSQDTKSVLVLDTSPSFFEVPQRPDGSEASDPGSTAAVAAS